MPTTATRTELEAQFDAIASLTPARSKFGATERWILANLPAPRRRAPQSRRRHVLDAGCGVGDLARALAPRFEETDAIDLSPGMIAEAGRRTPQGIPIRYACAELFEWADRHREAYDCIVSVATLHHVDLSAALSHLAGALVPGGRLLVVDLYDRPGLRHLLTNGLAFAVTAVSNAFAPSGRPLREAYRAHGAGESYLTLEEVASRARETLPAVNVHGTLRWRYRLLWDKPR